MRFTEEHDAFRASVRALVHNEINPHVDGWEAAGTFPAHQVFGRLATLGVLGLIYDERWGGSAAGYSFMAVAGEELGRIDCGGVPMAISVQMAMATPSLHDFGSDDLRQRYLVRAIAGEHVASIAVTEPDAGSDVAGLRTHARRDGDEWVINGTKLYITNGTQADWLCLLVRTGDEGGYRGMSQVLVPTSTDGLTVSRTLDKLGQRSSDTAELSFVDVRVPVDHTIGVAGRGFQQQMAQFQHERMIATFIAVGAMSMALERTRQYLKDRHVFGQPLLANQHLQFTLAELSAEVDLLRHYAYAAAEAADAGDDITRFATVCKLKAGRLQRQVADLCLQFHGGIGYMEDTWTARFYRDARLLSIGGGADEVMLRTLARLEEQP